LLDGSGSAQGGGDGCGGDVQGSPLGEQGLVSHGEPHLLIVVGVGEQQATLNEGF
jgi:hypothetical protein